VIYQVEMLDSFGRWQHLSLRDGWAAFSDWHSAALCVAHQVGRGWDRDRLRIVNK
jgi:hypothetical protein